jgi:predicted nucleotidyltransferase
MASHFKKLVEKQLITDAPSFLKNTTQYEVITGSMAYGVSHDNSDMDVYGFAIPPKHEMFPHFRGEIPDFDPFEVKFKQYQKHHILDQQALGGRGRTYDITIYSIARYFRLLTDNNPNIIDSLFVPRNCILHSTPIGDMIREQRQLFLHKGCWAKFKGYAYGHIHKIRTKTPIGKRKTIVEEHGYDIKFAYHVVRLLGEVEQLMIEQDLDLARNAEQLKAIRRGDWSIEELESYFTNKEKTLESVYQNCELPEKPNESAIRELLMNCLEQQYGSLEGVVIKQNKETVALRKIKKIIDDME